MTRSTTNIRLGTRTPAPAPSEDLLERSLEAVRSGNRVRARFIIRQCVQVDPLNTAAWKLLAELVATADEKIECYRTILKLESGAEDVRESLVHELHLKATEFVTAKQFLPAANHLREALVHAPQLARLWFELSKVELDDAEAIRCLNRTLELDRTHADAKVRLSAFQKLHGAFSCPICEALHRTAITTCPTCRAVLTLDQPAAFDTRPANDTELIEKCRERFESRPASDADLYTLGLIYLNLGRLSNAVKLLKTYVASPAADPQLRDQVRKLVERKTGGTATTASKLHEVIATKRAESPVQPWVLVLEQSPFIRKVLRTLLGEQGYLVDDCGNAEEFKLALQRHEQIALVVVDIDHPEAGDASLVQTMQAQERVVPTTCMYLTDDVTAAGKRKLPWPNTGLVSAKPLNSRPFLAMVAKHAPMSKLNDTRLNITRETLTKLD
jgi:CheY-like chemotaxis protein